MPFEVVLACIAAAICSSVVTAFIVRRMFLRQHNRDCIGVLQIDRSQPDEQPMCFMKVDRGVGDFSRMKYVMLEVVNEDLVPQE